MAAKTKTGLRKIRKKSAPRSARKGTKKPARRGVPLISQFMTASVHTIGRDQSLARAHQVMNEHRIRHLPVLDGGKLVGLLSQRDLYFVESLDPTRPERIRVDEAMTQDVSAAAPDTPLAEVVRTMVKKKHGCTVVTKGSSAVGLFSAIDALEALLTFLPG